MSAMSLVFLFRKVAFLPSPPSLPLVWKLHVILVKKWIYSSNLIMEYLFGDKQTCPGKESTFSGQQAHLPADLQAVL